MGLFVGLYSPLNVLKSWPNCVRSPQGNGAGWVGKVAGDSLGDKGEIEPRVVFLASGLTHRAAGVRSKR